MSRPHTEFIQAQWLPWQAEPLLPHLAGVSHKVLSRDPTTGAMTALLRFPAGWIANEMPPCSFDEELYTLDGAVSVNAVFFPADFYGCMPAGFPRQRATSQSGAVTLACYTPGTAGVSFDHGRWVPRIDVFSAIWPAAEPAHGLDLAAHHARARVLATDTDGAQTLVVGYPPVWQALSVETQSVDAEFYLLAGEATIDGRGTVTPGAYLWRPAGTTRAPMAARTGTVFLIRSHGAPLAFKAAGSGAVAAPARPDCVIPPDLARRFAAGPFATEAA